MKGQITVFLSLILLVTLSLISTIVETVRVNVAKAHIERTLLLSMDSILADYYLPLQKRYKLFLLNTTYDSDSNNSIIEDKMREYMEYSFSSPTNILGNYINMLESDIGNIEVTDKTSMLSYGDEIFVNQVIEYMKYRAPVSILEKFLDSFSLINKAKVTSSLLENKASINNTLEELDSELMKLAKLMDGISSVKYGNITVNENFIKKIYNGPITMSGVGINNEFIFNALKGKYISSEDILDYIQTNIKYASDLSKNIKALEEQLKNIQSSIGNLLSNISSESKQEEEVDNYFNILYSNEQTVKEKINDYQKSYNTIQKEIWAQAKSLNNSVKKINDYIYDSFNLLSEIEGKKAQALNEIDAYSELLTNNTDKMIPSVYQSLSEELSQSESYISGDKMGIIKNLPLMKETLRNNQKILNEFINDNYISILETENITAENSEVLITAAKQCKDKLSELSVKNLTLDYSNLFIGEKPDNPGDNIFPLAKLGVMNMTTYSTDNISQKTINKTGLPSQSLNLTADEDNSFDVESTENNLSEIKNFELEESQSNTMVNKLLINEYIMTFFKHAELKEKNDETFTVLDYEKEYIISGKESDYKNLENVLNKIMLIRFVLNVIHILSDRDKYQKAGSAAMSIASFAGTIGKAIGYGIKMLIISAWSYAESLIDCRILLLGKELSLIKTNTQWNLSYDELFTFSKKDVEQKSEKAKDASGFVYEDYIRLFLFMCDDEAINFRAMDLIQLNINSESSNDFTLDKCIYGFKAKINCNIKPFFMGIPDIYSYTLQREYTY